MLLSWTCFIRHWTSIRSSGVSQFQQRCEEILTKLDSSNLIFPDTDTQGFFQLKCNRTWDNQKGMKGMCLKQQENVNCFGFSQVVSHPDTNQSKYCFTLLFRWEPFSKLKFMNWLGISLQTNDATWSNLVKNVIFLSRGLITVCVRIIPGWSPLQLVHQWFDVFTKVSWNLSFPGDLRLRSPLTNSWTQKPST